MPSFEYETTGTLDFEVFCGTCGAGLCNLTSIGTTKRRGIPFIQVEACPTCMKNEYERGYEDGLDEGAAK